MKALLRGRLVGLGALVLLAACGDTCQSKEREITKYDLQEMVWKQVREPGKYTPPVFCPGNIDAHVGAETTCFMPIKGEQYDVHVEITSIDGKNVELAIEVASEPRDAGLSN